MVPWLPEAIRTVVTAAIYALYDFFNAAGKFIVDAYNEYAIFTLHVVIIALQISRCTKTMFRRLTTKRSDDVRIFTRLLPWS